MPARVGPLTMDVRMKGDMDGTIARALVASVVESRDAGLVLFDCAGRAVFMNAFARTHLGLPAGGPILPAGWRRAVHRDDQGAVRAWARADPREAEDMDIRLRDPSDASGWRWFACRSRWVGTSAVHPGLRMIHATDITARKILENSLRLATDRLEQTLADGPVMLSNQDRDLRVTWIRNPFSGRPPESLIGRTDAEILDDPLQAAPVMRLKRQVMETGQPVRGEFTVNYDDGVARQLAMVYSPIREPDGAIVGVSAVGFEVTEQRRIEQALRDADLRKDRWLALLAHELRGPLAPVRMVLGLPLDDDVPDEMRRRLKMIDRQVSFMARMVDDLLDMSRLDSGKLQLRCRPFDLGRLLSNFAEHSRLLVQAQGAHFVLQLPPGPVMIDADPMRIGQVVANLHSNARKFTPPGGVITVGLSVSADAVLVSVRDTGVGIEAENLERVFERFEQLTDPRNQPSAGLGLGLHLAREIVNAHGGRIEARSAGPGQGSEFIVSLPRRESCDGHATASWPEPQASQAGAARPAGSLRVLVVDDHRDTAESLVMLLQAWGHEAWCVHNGATGLREAEAKRPDVVILDISMPGMDGVEMARRIRAQPWGEPMVLIVQTGFGQESDFERTRAAGVQAHLVKPVEPERLRRLLAALASGGQVA